MVIRLPLSYIVAKKGVSIQGVAKAVGSSVTQADAAGMRNLSALVSAGYLLPDQEQNPHYPSSAGKPISQRPEARRRSPAAYPASVRRAMRT